MVACSSVSDDGGLGERAPEGSMPMATESAADSGAPNNSAQRRLAAIRARQEQAGVRYAIKNVGAEARAAYTALGKVAHFDAEGLRLGESSPVRLRFAAIGEKARWWKPCRLRVYASRAIA
jgi:hypothetical protein